MSDQNVAIEVIDSQSNIDFPLSINPLKYIPIERIIELRKKRLSCAEIAKVLGCSKTNIVQRLHKVSEELDNTDRYVKERATILAFQQRRIIQSITDADVKKAGLLEKVKSASFLHNAERLERGQSTQNIAYADILRARDKIKEELEELDNMSSTGSI